MHVQRIVHIFLGIYVFLFILDRYPIIVINFTTYILENVFIHLFYFIKFFESSFTCMET